MCITFFYVNQQPLKAGFRLILAMNRDEFYARPAKTLSWTEDGKALAGFDMTPGKEGGTWLAVNKAGEIGFLTNISTGTVEQSGKGRGMLILDYLKRDDPSNFAATDYLRCISMEKVIYNPFNLTLISPQKEGGNFDINYYCRGKLGHVVDSMGPTTLENPEDGVFALSNHPLPRPFLKTQEGKKAFKELVEGPLNDISKKSELKEAIFGILTNKDKHMDDQQLRSQCGHDYAEEKLKAVSSIFVDTPVYGSRTQSIVLIDHDWNLEFSEAHKNEDGTWSGKSETFKINLRK